MPGRIGINSFDALGVEDAMAITNQIEKGRHHGVVRCPPSGNITPMTNLPIK